MAQRGHVSVVLGKQAGGHVCIWTCWRMHVLVGACMTRMRDELATGRGAINCLNCSNFMIAATPTRRRAR